MLGKVYRVCYRQGQHEQALERYEVLRIKQAIYRHDHADVALSLLNIGVVV
jgi:hypothetical protein